MSPRNIPGFYYDEAKGKYFKIQPSHIAPNGSPYSNDVVRKEARGQIVRKCQKLFEEKTLKQRTQRSKILGNALLGCSGLEREGGSSLDRRSVIDKAWALGLEKTAILETWGPGALFARDEATGAGVVGDTADRDVANPRGCTRSAFPMIC